MRSVLQGCKLQPIPDPPTPIDHSFDAMPLICAFFRTLRHVSGLFEPVILWQSVTYAILQGGDNSIDMDVGGLDEDLGAGLGPGDGGAGDIDIRDRGLHRFWVEFWLAIVADEFDVELRKEGLVLLVSGEEQHKVGGD